MSDTQQLFPGKQFISTVLDALDTKHAMTGQIAQRYLQRSGTAGMIIAVFYLANYLTITAFAHGDPHHEAATLGKLVGALVFGWALVFIYYTKSELLTSNMMIVTIGTYYHRIKWYRGLRLLALCYLGNIIGGALIAALLAFSTLTAGNAASHLDYSVGIKLAYLETGAGVVDLLIRAILCNFMINLAMLLVYNGYIKDDLTKCLAMIVSVFVFAFLGLEHSVANTVLFTIVGFQGNLDLLPALGNVAVCLVGNFIGGGLLIGLYYAYANDDTRYLRRQSS
ncbi:formate/nitrite transporter FocA (FNT family) [Kineosphaera limosa]|uniref:Putative formate transporter n=1 Tax=Kineosphaera limosa NBRC 100340 TaxID=1184609 RepID=K6WF05_9MICO|nr:formate/nitrite transporter family protein [Kineosphaera limosa]NYE00740.1 formate/nitrite transporter FocA (FNT family) [Kineosphaera limosa]GAB97850.1 putative formate transporter [Kineosphaera limosa NBRC 100340]